MSLLEDVFLQDEAGEAQELERIIEGDEYDERPRPSTPNSDDDSEKEDEAEEDKRQVDPTSAKPKRVVKNPRFILNPARLTGPRGIQLIPEHFKNFKFKGKGHEKDDLDMVLKKLEHWAYRLYPKFQFEDCLKKIETLGKKRPVMVHLHKIRTDQFTSEETVVQKDSSDDEIEPAPVQEEDEFDKLLQQQIELARATPAPASARKPAFSTPMVDKGHIIMPKVTSSPSISEDQRERMLRNRQLAEERRLARLKQNTSELELHSPKNTEPQDTSNVDHGLTDSHKSDEISELPEDIEDNISKSKTNRSNMIDSSDEDDSVVMNETITVDVHETKSVDNVNNKTGGSENSAHDVSNSNKGDFESEESNPNINNKDSIDNNEESDNLNSLVTNEAEDPQSAINRPNSDQQGESMNQGSVEVIRSVSHEVTENLSENMDVDFNDDF